MLTVSILISSFCGGATSVSVGIVSSSVCLSVVLGQVCLHIDSQDFILFCTYLFLHEKTFFRLEICYRSDCLIFVFPLFPAKIFLELKIYYWSDCQSVRRAFNTAGVEGWVGDFQTIIKSNEKVSEMTRNHCICVFSFPR